MSERDYRILTGTAGWKHPGWANEVFYPEDLPEDWYLSFYANEFPVVLVPDTQWLTDADIESLVNEIEEQTSTGFKCVFACHWSETGAAKGDAQAGIAERAEKLAAVGHTFAGLLIQVAAHAVESPRFSDDIASLSKKFKVCLELSDNMNEKAVSDWRLFCDTHKVSLCWRGQGEVIVADGSPLWVARCNGDQENKAVLQQLKTIISEQYKHESLSREHIIIVDGSPPKIEVVRNAMTMMDIM